VSSGIDSIVAAHYIIKNLQKKSLNINLLHFNHNLRPQNHFMEKMFYQFAETFNKGVCAVIQRPIADTSKTEGELKAFRMKWLSVFSNQIFVAAHHLNDCVESYLLNIIRGKEGFLPMPFVTEVGSNAICRPFLFTKKTDIEEYAVKNNLLQYVVFDETNNIVKGSRRNFLRHRIIPLLDQEHVGLDTIVKKKMQERLTELTSSSII
jgi:tRNA(Ile)-lysidine synthase TilS/MesJ